MGTVAAHDFKNKLESKLPPVPDREPAIEMHFPMEETFTEIKSKTTEVYDSSIQLVRKNPIKSLAVALGVGVATGYFLKRR